MAEPPGMGKQHPKRHMPSRLRHEIRPDSTEDENGPRKHVVEVPDSQEVPEKQLEHNEHVGAFDREIENESDYGDVSLSPNSIAMLERTTVTKKTEGPESAPFKVRLLSKGIFGLGDSSTSSSSPAFSFGQAIKSPSKTSPKEEVATLQPIAPANLTAPIQEQRDGHTSNDSSTVAAPPAHSPPPPSSYVKRDAQDEASTQDTNELPPSSHVPSTAHRETEAGHAGSEMPEASYDTPPFAQPGSRPGSANRKIRVVRKSKKGKKGLLSQQRGAPWPPRSSNSTGHAGQVAVLDQTVPETFADSRDLGLFQNEAQDDQVHATLEEDKRDHVVVHDYQTDVLSHSAHVPHKIEQKNMDWENREHEMHASNPAPPNSPGVFTQPVLPASLEHAFPIAFEQQPMVEPTQQPQVFHNRSAGSLREDATSEQHTMPLHQKTSLYYAPRITKATNNVPALTNQLSQPEVDMNTGQPMPQRKEAEAVLHGTSAQGGPHRVVKLRKKIRAVSGTSPHCAQGPSIPSNVERSMESLRVAMLADNFRVQHEHNMTTKQHEETTTTLKNMVGLQTETIADLRRKHDELDGALTRLTEKAKTNQRYVTGLQKDYEKLQKSVTLFRDQNKEVLQAKIVEIENEKDSLRREFDLTIETLTRSQRSMKSTVDELYVRLVISESKKKDLVENLSKQTAVCEEERRKRDDLEKQLLSSVQSIQRQLGDSSSALIDKLELLQSSVYSIAIDDGQDADVKECLAILRNLQTTPFLTARDVEKAEGMLRYVHERVDSGLGTLSETVKSKEPPNDEVKTFIKQQLQHLQNEMVKFEEVVFENRKAHESNDTLTKQLEAQQQHSVRLENQIKSLQQSEADLKARSTQLERGLNNLKDTAHEPQSEPSEFEQGILDLRQQLEKAEEDLKTANTKTEKFDQVRQELEQEVAKYKSRYEAAKGTLFKLDADAKLKQKTENVAGMRENIVKDCQRLLTEKESGFNNEIHRLIVERNEMKQAREELQDEVNAAKDKLQELRKSNKTLEFDLDAARKEQAATEAKLKTAQQGSPSKSSEVANLKEQLQQKTEEFQSKTRDYIELERQCVDLSNKATDLQGLHDQLQAQVSQHILTIETMRQEADYQLSEARQDARSTLQLARDQISTLQQEKRDLLSRFEQTRSNEAKLNNAQTTSSTERDGLQQQLTELRAAKDAETLSIRADAAEKNQKLTDSHRTDIGDWSRRLTQTSAALKEKEAEVRRFREESRLKLNSDRRVAETKLLQVEQSYRKQLEEAKAQSSRDQQQASQSSVVDETPSRPLQNIHAGKNRKKVSRQNHSMLNVAGDSNTQSDYAVGPSQITQTEVSQTRREAPKVYQSLFEEDAGAEELLDEFSLSLVNREVEQVPETQEFGGLSMSLDDFDQRINQASHHPTKHQNTSSTDLSIISSDEMDQIQRDAQPMSTLMLRGYDRSSSKHNDAMETPMRSDNVSVSDSHSSHSHDRPRSQANTASRLMPPPGNVSHHSQPRDQSQGAGAKVASRRPMYEKIGQKLNSNGKSSPDFMHPPSSASKHTYGQHDTRNSARNEPRPSTPQAMEQSHTQKRKSSNSRTERETTVKKQRTSSQSYPTISPSGSRSQSPYLTRPSVVGSRLKTQTGLSYAQDPSLTATSRSKTQASSSSVPPRASSRLPSSSEMYSSCRQQPSSSQVQGAGPTRRTSSRLKKRSRNDTAFEDRFSQELNRR